MRLVAVMAAFLLVGCAGERDPDVKVVRVNVPVVQKCDIDIPVPPAYAVDSLPIGAPIDTQMRALRAERHQRIGYEVLLRAEIEKCKR